MSTVDVARRMAEVAGVLAQLPAHLPAISGASVGADNVVYLSGGYSGYSHREIRHIAEWAGHFGQPVTLDLSSGIGALAVTVSLSGLDFVLRANLGTHGVYEVATLLGVPVRSGEQTQVAPAALLAALDTEDAGAAVTG